VLEAECELKELLLPRSEEDGNVLDDPDGLDADKLLVAELLVTDTEDCTDPVDCAIPELWPDLLDVRLADEDAPED
jgi:hypothetical protein